MKSKRKTWTKEEINILKKNAGKLSIQEVADLLNRPYMGTIDIIRRLKIPYKRRITTNWTKKEISTLQKLIHTHTSKEIGKLLNRSETAISAKRWLLKIKRDPIIWTKEEDKILFEKRFILTISEVSTLLYKSTGSVCVRLKQLGISYNTRNKPTKTCIKCKKEFPNNYEYFSEQKYKLKLKDGSISQLSITKSSCKTCQSEYNLAWRAKNPNHKRLLKRQLKTVEEYETSLARIDQLMDAEANTPECDELEFLGLLVERYEKKHYKLPKPEPNDIIQHNLEQRGLITK